MNTVKLSRPAILLMLLVLTAVPQTLGCEPASNRAESANLPAPQTDLGKYVGRYPSDLFKGEPGLKQRLRRFLGVNYKLFVERLQTEMPIEDYDGALIVRGCKAHSCGFEVAILAVRPVDGRLHVAIKSEKFGGKFRIFSQDKAHIPAALDYAMRQ
jgi:hypothetical protein